MQFPQQRELTNRTLSKEGNRAKEKRGGVRGFLEIYEVPIRAQAAGQFCFLFRPWRCRKRPRLWEAPSFDSFGCGVGVFTVFPSISLSFQLRAVSSERGCLLSSTFGTLGQNTERYSFSSHIPSSPLFFSIPGFRILCIFWISAHLEGEMRRKLID